jgi:transcriptional regulator with XRE-family HTH domain
MEKRKEEKLIKFGLHIKKMRDELNLSQDKVALNSDKLIKATISEVENGKRNLSFTTLLDLAKGMGKHPRELLDYD